MTNKIFFLLLFLNVSAHGQDKVLGIFEPLTDRIWKAEGKWADGSDFRQEIEFRYSLDSTLVIAESKGFVDKEQTKFGLRNHGIRQYDKESKKIRFWEFDVFGGFTEGEILVMGEDFYYSYSYGNTTITDAWIKLDDNTYRFVVGTYVDNQWKQKYLETVFSSKTE